MADDVELALMMNQRVLDESLSQPKQNRHWTVVALVGKKEKVINFDAATQSQRVKMMAQHGIRFDSSCWAGGYPEADGTPRLCGRADLQPIVRRLILARA